MVVELSLNLAANYLVDVFGYSDENAKKYVIAWENYVSWLQETQSNYSSTVFNHKIVNRFFRYLKKSDLESHSIVIDNQTVYDYNKEMIGHLLYEDSESVIFLDFTEYFS